jgi:hypothetical protein
VYYFHVHVPSLNHLQCSILKFCNRLLQVGVDPVLFLVSSYQCAPFKISFLVKKLFISDCEYILLRIHFLVNDVRTADKQTQAAASF